MKHTWEQIRDMVAEEQKRQEDAAEGEGKAKCSDDGHGSLMFEGKPLHRLPRTLERTTGKRK